MIPIKTRVSFNSSPYVTPNTCDVTIEGGGIHSIRLIIKAPWRDREKVTTVSLSSKDATELIANLSEALLRGYEKKASPAAAEQISD